MKMSIIIPAYNEENRIEETIEDYYSYFNYKLGYYEIIIVCNNCTDRTVRICKMYENDIIKIIEVPKYTGKGGAVIEGFKIARGDYVGFVDADNSITPKEFNKLYENIRYYDGIIGSRVLGEAKGRSLKERLSSWMFRKAVRYYTKMNYQDTQCGAKIFTKETAGFIAENLKETGWSFDVELLYLCDKTEREICEYPIEWISKEGSKLTIKDGLRSVSKLRRIK